MTSKYSRPVRLQDADAAGILFFANWIVFAHEAYESMMVEIGFDFASMIKQRKFIVLIAHTEADFLRPVRLGDIVTVELFVANLSTSSFTLEYSLSTSGGERVGQCKTVHVVVNKASGNKMPMSEKLRQALGAFASG
jgi:1,4-dihydroxy-2-naphthoyl-CoA hydrolase